MFSFLKRKQSSNRYVGVSFHQDAVSVAMVSKNKQGLVLDHLDHRVVDSHEQLPATLKSMVSDAGLKGVPANVVMEPVHYSLLQVEVPEVDQDELKNAVRWRVKDLLDFHIDDAVIDLVILPQSRRVGAPKLMYVIATKSSQIEKIVKNSQDAGLKLESIDVTELALRNMTFADAQENRAGAFLYLSKNLSLIEICDNGTLCLSRHISLDTDRFDVETPEGRVEMMDMLSLEIQRSLDYYESQFSNGGASQLNVASQCAVSVDEFKEVAGSYLTVPIEGLSSLQQISGTEQYDASLLTTCLPTIGGAIREFVWKS